MDSQKESLLVGNVPSREPEIGRWLWTLEDTRQRTLREINQLTPAMIDWLPPDDGSSIGTILYHMADIEADWLYVEVLERPMPPEISSLFLHPTRNAQGHLTQVAAYSLEQHLRRLETVRALLLDVFQQMDLADFRRARSLPTYDVTPEWVLHHLMQHEAEHRGQLGTLRVEAERHLGLA